MRCRTRPRSLSTVNKPVRPVDVARQHDDEVALIAQIVDEPPAIGILKRGKLAHEVLAHRIEAFLGLIRWFCGLRFPASPARLYVCSKEVSARASVSSMR